MLYICLIVLFSFVISSQLGFVCLYCFGKQIDMIFVTYRLIEQD